MEEIFIDREVLMSMGFKPHPTEPMLVLPSGLFSLEWSALGIFLEVENERLGLPHIDTKQKVENLYEILVGEPLKLRQ